MANTYKLGQVPSNTPEPSPSAPRSVVTPGRPETPVATGAGKPVIARLTSLDAFRGFIMILLAGSGFGIAALARLPESAAVWQRPVIENGTERPPTAEEVAARRDWWKVAAFHFTHPDWRSDFLVVPVEDPETRPSWQRVGVSFWDLIQPAFMFMVGAAMPFSYRRRMAEGQSKRSQISHAFFRSVILVLMGVWLYSVNSPKTNWIFPNVLAQIGLGYFFVYLLMGFRWRGHVVAIALILGGYWYFMQFGYWQMTGEPKPDGTYDVAAVNASPERGEVLAGAFAPWSKNDNAAHAVDVHLLNALRDPDGQQMAAWRERTEQGELSWGEWLMMSIRRTLFANPEPFLFNGGGYQTLNFIPSIATMLLGVIMGRVLMEPGGSGRKLLVLLLAGLICLVLGRLAGTYVCPIVKRIWTPSWALLSGAYVIWMLAAFYVVFDILPLRRLAFPLSIVGMNSIVIYVMGELMRPFTTKAVVRPHLTGLLEVLLGTDPALDGPFYLLHDEMFGRVIFPVAVLAVFWLIAYWLWRQRIFVRI